MSTRVKDPDEDNMKKLIKVTKYLHSTNDLPLTLSAGKSGNNTWWVDSSYAVHDDMKGQAEASMSLGKGSVNRSSKKLVSRSSKESKFIGVHNVMSQILWSQHFLQSRVFQVNETIFKQENKSTMLLDKNGRLSSGKQTKHIDIRY
jgi:hypothetical protein